MVIIVFSLSPVNPSAYSKIQICDRPHKDFLEMKLREKMIEKQREK